MSASSRTVLPFPSAEKRRPGRPLGATDKVSRDLRAKIRSILESSADDVLDWMNAAAAKDPYQGVQAWIGLSKYVLPTLSATAIADITPAPAPVREKLQHAGVDERHLLSPRVATLIASGTVENFEGLLAHLTDGTGEAIDTEQRSGEVIDAEVVEVETDELLR